MSGWGWRDEQKGTLHIAVQLGLSDSAEEATLRAVANEPLLAELVPAAGTDAHGIVTLPVTESTAGHIENFMTSLRSRSREPRVHTIIDRALGAEPLPELDSGRERAARLPGLETPRYKRDLATLGHEGTVHGRRYTPAPPPGEAPPRRLLGGVRKVLRTWLSWR